jgi:hypothetical protein
VGTWQPKLGEAEPHPDDDQSHRFWIFVDLTKRSSRPTYYVVPEPWIQADIRETHREYIARHGGQRARTPDSDHHSVDEGRIHEWEERWEILGLSSRFCSLARKATWQITLNRATPTRASCAERHPAR